MSTSEVRVVQTNLRTTYVKLKQLVEDEEDPERRSKLRGAFVAFSNASKQVMEALGTAST